MGGVFRGMTAFGMMFSFIIDGNGGSYIGQLIFQFVCYFVGIVFLYIVTIKWVTDELLLGGFGHCARTCQEGSED